MDELTVLFQNDGETISKDKFGKTYIISKNNEAVVMLARHLDSFIFVKQFRKPMNDYVIQLSGGIVEEGEDFEEAVRREFHEEVGAQCGRIQQLGIVTPASWISNIVTHVFYTEDIISFTDQRLEEYENIEVMEIRIDETMNMIRDNRINDSEVTYAILQGIIKGLIKV
jgi:ADP-ribose pyrophosphatase